MMFDPARTIYIETFRAGESVPDWLLTLVPDTAFEGFVALTFREDVSVVKAWGSYWLIPKTTGAACLTVDGSHIEGKQKFSISNPNEPVTIPTSTMIIGGQVGSTLTIKGDVEDD